jgi:glycosyltransferase involved in cell wall biosynthesis
MSSPRTLHLVFNSVREDSRVLKVAWSLSNNGWDVLVVGATPYPHNDHFQVGAAEIKRLPLKPVIQNKWIARLGRKYRRVVQLAKRFLLIPPKQKGGFTGIPNISRAVNVLKPVALQFTPEIIHAHDYTILPVAGRLKEYLASKGIKTQLIYDAHEYVPGVAHLKPLLRDAYTQEERKWSKQSASVLSVSEGMSELLIKHLEIDFQPEIVANDPLVEGQITSHRNLRADTGLVNGEKIMVYSGAVAPQRGLHTAVAALPQLPGVHLVVIANPENATVKDLLAKNPTLADRIHIQPYVPNNELVDYLKGADLGLIPILHRLNHEISLITKFGEYMQAKLPILVSDVKTMAAEVRRLGNGEVFVAEDVNDFVIGAKKILEDKAKYQAAYTTDVLAERTWEKQGEELTSIYNRIAGVNPIRRTPARFLLTEPERLSHDK